MIMKHDNFQSIIIFSKYFKSFHLFTGIQIFFSFISI